MRAKKIKASIIIFTTIIITLLIFRYIFTQNTTTSNATSTIKYTHRTTKLSLTDEELRLLISLTHAEARNSTYEEKLAVVNIIINRIHNDNFPPTVYDVIYSKNQFPSTNNGALNKHLWEYDCGNFTTPQHLDSIKAVNAAINGINNIENRLYYSKYWPKADYSTYNNTCIIKNHIFW